MKSRKRTTEDVLPVAQPTASKHCLVITNDPELVVPQQWRIQMWWNLRQIGRTSAEWFVGCLEGDELHPSSLRLDPRTHSLNHNQTVSVYLPTNLHKTRKSVCRVQPPPGARNATTPCLKKLQTYFVSEFCQISTDCGNFWHKDSKVNNLFWGLLVFHLT